MNKDIRYSHPKNSSNGGMYVCHVYESIKKKHHAAAKCLCTWITFSRSLMVSVGDLSTPISYLRLHASLPESQDQCRIVTYNSTATCHNRRRVLYFFTDKKPSCRWGTARARCQLKSGECCTNVRRISLEKACNRGEWPSRSFVVTNTGAIRQIIYDFLLVFL